MFCKYLWHTTVLLNCQWTIRKVQVYMDALDSKTFLYRRCFLLQHCDGFQDREEKSRRGNQVGEGMTVVGENRN